MALSTFQDRLSKYFVTNPWIDVLTCTTGGTFQKMYDPPKYARKVSFLNLTTALTSVITITSEFGTAKGISGTAKQGEVLNPAAVAGQGGGSSSWGDLADPFSLIDISKFFWTSTNTSDQLAVKFEYPAEKLY